MNVELPIPDEPVQLKKEIQSQLPDDGFANWDIESMAVWSGNAVQSYLWDEWKEILGRCGFDWQTFLKLMGQCTSHFTAWINDEKDWSEVVRGIERVLDEIGSLILASR